MLTHASWNLKQKWSSSSHRNKDSVSMSKKKKLHMFMPVICSSSTKLYPFQSGLLWLLLHRSLLLCTSHVICTLKLWCETLFEKVLKNKRHLIMCIASVCVCVCMWAVCSNVNMTVLMCVWTFEMHKFEWRAAVH